MVGAIGQLLAVVITIVGFVFVTWQIRAARKVASADFMLRLESEFLDHHLGAYNKLAFGGPWSVDQAGPSTASKVSELELYMNFFANLQVLRAEKLLALETIDRMFAFRFFVAAHNPHTHRVLASKREFWTYLYALYSDWIQLRAAQGKPIPNEQHKLPK
jgi:hypothetical protein